MNQKRDNHALRKDPWGFWFSEKHPHVYPYLPFRERQSEIEKLHEKLDAEERKRKSESPKSKNTGRFDENRQRVIDLVYLGYMREDIMKEVGISESTITAWLRRLKDERALFKQCRECGKTYRIDKSINNLYCSDPCKSKYKRKLAKK